MNWRTNVTSGSYLHFIRCFLFQNCSVVFEMLYVMCVLNSVMYTAFYLQVFFINSRSLIMQGYYRLNTTILSDTYKYANYTFRPFWPSSGWIQYQRKKLRNIIWYSLCGRPWGWVFNMKFHQAKIWMEVLQSNLRFYTICTTYAIIFFRSGYIIHFNIPVGWTEGLEFVINR
jgi:hypothetical protein